MSTLKALVRVRIARLWLSLSLVMEYVDGVDLDALLDTGPLSVPLVLHLASEILTALAYAHDLPLTSDDDVCGLVHRDISPHNVMLSWVGDVKLGDFGMAKGRVATEASRSLLIKGKPAYMSPEQVNGKPLDGRSDLFAVGVMLWQMLTHRLLFAGGTIQETLARLLTASIEPPHAVRSEVPADVSAVVMGLLARDPRERTPTASAALAQLTACTSWPTNGRKLLMETLAERYAGRAARRAHRLARSGPEDATRVTEDVRSRPDGQVTLTQPQLPAGSLPTLSLDEQGGATPTAAPSRRHVRWAIGGGAFAAISTAALAVAVLGRGAAANSTPPASSAAATSGSAAASSTPPGGSAAVISGSAVASSTPPGGGSGATSGGAAASSTPPGGGSGATSGGAATTPTLSGGSSGLTSGSAAASSTPPGGTSAPTSGSAAASTTSPGNSTPPAGNSAPTAGGSALHRAAPGPAGGAVRKHAAPSTGTDTMREVRLGEVTTVAPA